jgi:hypothetical protein
MMDPLQEWNREGGTRDASTLMHETLNAHAAGIRLKLDSQKSARRHFR